MSPSTRLNQGSFEDTDILLADNFAKAAAKQKLKQIIYLGGIIPETTSVLSAHLRSRLEVEEIFSGGLIPSTALRASIIIGPGGSSFEMMTGLINKLPVLGCPKWTSSECQPLDVRYLMKVFAQVIGNSAFYDQSIDIGGQEIVTYRQLLESCARAMGKRRAFISVPINSVGFSKWWVAQFSSTSIELVSPLIDSLTHNMKMVHPDARIQLSDTTLEDSISYALSGKAPDLPLRSIAPEEKNTVRSIQRLTATRNQTAYEVGKLYPEWLSTISLGIIKTIQTDNRYEVKLLGIKILELTEVAEKSNQDRLVYFVTGGALVKRTEHGWLEFRSVLGGRHIMVALHEFVPRISWPFYRVTQAVLHLWVTKWFNRSI
ncbi:MAG: hypothetical protein ACI9DM_001847 [Cyclobacteriaceae bacterium]|jgi:uncharacterized protein YbjT (DUF2867 family)